MSMDNSVTAAADSASPLAKMAHSAVSLRNSNGSATTKGRSAVAVSNWELDKARSVDTWASGLEASGLQSSEQPGDNENRGSRTMRFGIGRLSASVEDGHRENSGVYRGRQEAAGLEHPNLHLWSTSGQRNGTEGKQAVSVGGEGYTNTDTRNETAALPPRGLPNIIPSRFANTLSASSQRRDISKASSTRSSVPVLVVPYTPPPQPSSHHAFSPAASTTSHQSRFSFSSLPAPRIPKSIYKMRSAGPPAQLPAVSEFSFESIMEWAKQDDMESGRQGVQGDLERIAEICARSRLSLANQYERHMPPHGVGQGFGLGGEMGGGNGEGRRDGGVAQRRARKGKSKALETLETIYASSSSGRSSKDGKGRKKSAMDLAVEVKERNEREARHSANGDKEAEHEQGEDADHERSVIEGSGGRDHVRREGLIVGSRHTQNGKDGKRRKRLAAVVIDTASDHGSKSSSRRLTSRPLKPRTSSVEMGVNTIVEAIAVHEQIHNTETITTHTPHITLTSSEPPIPIVPIIHEQLASQTDTRSQFVLGTFSRWLPWLSHPQPSVESVPAEAHTETYFEVLPSAQGSLKRLLDVSEKSKRRSGERSREAG